MLSNKETLLIILVICVIVVFYITLKKCSNNAKTSIYNKITDFKNQLMSESSSSIGDMISNKIDEIKSRFTDEDKQKIENKVNETIDDRINQKIEEYEKQHGTIGYDVSDDSEDEEEKQTGIITDDVQQNQTTKTDNDYHFGLNEQQGIIKDTSKLNNRVKDIAGLIKSNNDTMGYSEYDSQYYYL